MRKSRQAQIHDAALAVTVTGDVLLNVAHARAAVDLADLIRELSTFPRDAIFVGVVLRRREVTAVLERLDDASAEAAARVIASRQRRRARDRRKGKRGA